MTPQKNTQSALRSSQDQQTSTLQAATPLPGQLLAASHLSGLSQDSADAVASRRKQACEDEDRKHPRHDGEDDDNDCAALLLPEGAAADMSGAAASTSGSATGAGLAEGAASASAGTSATEASLAGTGGTAGAGSAAGTGALAGTGGATGAGGSFSFSPMGLAAGALILAGGAAAMSGGRDGVPLATPNGNLGLDGNGLNNGGHGTNNGSNSGTGNDGAQNNAGSADDSSNGSNGSNSGNTNGNTGSGSDNAGSGLNQAERVTGPTVPHNGESAVDSNIFLRGSTSGKSVDYVVLQRIRTDRPSSEDGDAQQGGNGQNGNNGQSGSGSQQGGSGQNQGNAGNAGGNSGHSGESGSNPGTNGSNDSNDDAGLWLRNEDGTVTRLKEGDTISKADFARVFWNARGNVGGEFQFVSSDEHGTPVSGSTPQIVTIGVQPLPPAYPGAPVTHTSAYDQTLALEATDFTGTDPAKSPAGGVRIDSITPKDADGDAPALFLKGADGTLTPVTAATVISPADFANLVWDSAHNAGGTFSFTPLNRQGTPIEDAPQQTITIDEAPQAPAYPEHAGAKVDHDTQDALRGSLFAGTDNTRRPPAVRIEAVKSNGDDEGGQSPAYVLRNGHREYLEPGTLVKAEDFERVFWNSTTNEGGSITFTPVDAEGNEVPGWTKQEITIREFPASPDYPEEEPTLSLANGSTLMLPESLFTGTTPANKPAFIKITAIDARMDVGSEAPAMLVGPDGSLTPVRVGDIIPADQFANLRWNAAHNTGGSFEFVALDADHDLLPGTEAQTINIHESPVAPVYETPGILRVGHDAISTSNASTGIFSGQAAENRPDKIRIESIDPKNDTDPDRPALYIDRDGTKEPLAPDSVIDAADFSKIRWDAGDNEGGTFRFTALDSSNRPILNADQKPVTQTVEVRESPLGPVYEGNRILGVPLDARLPIGPEVFEGTDASRKPAFIKITAIDPIREDPARPGSLRFDPDGDGPQKSQAAEVGQTIAAADFDKLDWSSSRNEGGSFRFQPLDEHKQPIIGFEEQTVNIFESPKPPVYTGSAGGSGSTGGTGGSGDAGGSGGSGGSGDPNDTGVTVKAGQNAVHELNRAIFDGADATLAPSYILITKIDVTDPASGQPTPLMIKGPDGKTTPVQAPFTLARDDFDKLVWDTSHNHGGSFGFAALDKDYKPILTKEGGVATRVVTVDEETAVPAYQESTTTVNVAHDGTVALDESRFTGSAANRAPAGIRITAVNATNHKAGTPILQMDPDGSGPAAPTPLTVGNVVEAANFDKLSWTTIGNNGGSFRFVPVDEKGKDIPGAGEQTVTVKEGPADVPTYGIQQPPLKTPENLYYNLKVTPHDMDYQFEASTFEGRDAAKAPAKIRITAITPKDPTDTTANTLQIDRDGAGGKAPEQVQVGQEISRADFDKLSWNSVGNNGGTFTFEAIDGKGEKLAGVDPQTVTVHESPIAPTYAGTSALINVAGHSMHYFGKIPGILDKMMGTDVEHRPAYVMVWALEGNDPIGNRQTLLSYTSGRASTVNQGKIIGYDHSRYSLGVFSAEEIPRLAWNSQSNTGGKIHLVALDEDQVPILDANRKPVTYTIDVHELQEAPQYTNPTLSVAHDAKDTSIDSSHFTGQTSYVLNPGGKDERAVVTQEPPQVRIDGTFIANQPGKAAESGLFMYKDGKRTDLHQGDRILAKDFDKVHWDATRGDGDTLVKFTLLDDRGTEILHRTFTPATGSFVVSEAPASTTSASGRAAPIDVNELFGTQDGWLAQPGTQASSLLTQGISQAQAGLLPQGGPLSQGPALSQGMPELYAPQQPSPLLEETPTLLPLA